MAHKNVMYAISINPRKAGLNWFLEGVFPKVEVHSTR